MACTYAFAVNASSPCFLDVERTDTGPGGPLTRLDRQFNLSFIKWEEKGDDDLTIFDGYSVMTLDIDQVPAFATVADLIAFLEPLRAACSIVPSGGGGTPTAVNGTVTYDVETGVGATAAGLHGVSITNIGTANGVVLGDTIKPGQTVTYNCYYNPVTLQLRTLPAISFDGTGTELAINTFV